MIHARNHIKFIRILIVLPAYALLWSCLHHSNIHVEEWEVVSVNQQSILFTPGETIAFSTNNLHVNSNGEQKKYPCIISDGRMVIETPMEKWLFEIETSDSVLVLRELYVKDPLEIELTNSIH